MSRLGWALLFAFAASATAQESGIPREIRALGSGDFDTRAMRIEAVARHGVAALPALRRAVGREGDDHRNDALRVLRRLGKAAAPALPEVRAAMTHENRVTRCLAALVSFDAAPSSSDELAVLSAELHYESKFGPGMLWDLIDDLRGFEKIRHVLWQGFVESRGEDRLRYACAAAAAGGARMHPALMRELDRGLVDRQGGVSLVHAQALADLGELYDRDLAAHLADESVSRRLAATEVCTRRSHLPAATLATIVAMCTKEPNLQVRALARASAAAGLEPRDYWKRGLAWEEYEEAPALVKDMGERGDPATIRPLLLRAARHIDARVRSEAALVIGERLPADAEARAAVGKLLETDPTPTVQHACVRGLVDMQLGPELTSILRQADETRLRQLLESIPGALHVDPQLYPLVVALLGAESAEIAHSALQALRAGGADAAAALRDGLSSDDPDVWGRCAFILGIQVEAGRFPADSIAPLHARLRELARKSEQAVHGYAVDLLWRLGRDESEARRRLRAALTSEDELTRHVALDVTARLGPGAAMLRTTLDEGLADYAAPERGLRMDAVVSIRGAEASVIGWALERLLEADDEDWGHLLAPFRRADAQSRDAWMALIRRTPPPPTERVVWALCQRRDGRTELEKPLVRYLSDGKGEREELAAAMLGCLAETGDEAVRVLRAALVERKVDYAGWALGRIGLGDTIDWLAGQLTHESAAVRAGAADGLGQAARLAAAHWFHLRDCCRAEKDPDAKAAMLDALEEIPEPANFAIGLGGGAPRKR